MIVEKLDNWKNCFAGPTWTTVFEALEKLAPQSPEGETLLQGRDIAMRVMRYETRGINDAVLEAHREYVDVQAVIAGAERLDWYPADELTIKTPYDAQKDVMFFEKAMTPSESSSPLGPAHVTLVPGRFCVLFPSDAHMPQMMIGLKPESVLKVVFKVRRSLVANAQG